MKFYEIPDNLIEDGDHVIRSTEFDVLAADEDLDRAVMKFVETAEDYVRFILDIARDASRDEAQSALLLLERLSQIYPVQLADARREARRLIRLRRRNVPARVRGGYRRSPLKSSSPLSHD